MSGGFNAGYGGGGAPGGGGRQLYVANVSQPARPYCRCRRNGRNANLVYYSFPSMWVGKT